MASHTILITVVNEGGERIIRAEPTLGVNDGDSVTWEFRDEAGNAVPLRVKFQSYLPSRFREASFAVSTTGPFIGPIPTAPATIFGPFTVTAEAANGMYVYSIFEGVEPDDHEIKWETPAFTVNSYGGFFGTIQKPGGPPTSGSARSSSS